jgi:hypothetical protein
LDGWRAGRAIGAKLAGWLLRPRHARTTVLQLLPAKISKFKKEYFRLKAV